MSMPAAPPDGFLFSRIQQLAAVSQAAYFFIYPQDIHM
jgi:hypothetical protein